MSFYSSRFGQEGVNLAADNSFRLQISNASTSAFTLNLFHLGGNATTQTAITTGQVSIPTNSNQSIPFFVNGVVTDPFGMEIALETISNGASFVFPLGTTIAQINTFYQNNVINPLITPQVGSFVLVQKPNTTDQYDMIITIDISPNVVAFVDLNFPPLAILFSFNTEQVSFVTNNPLVTIRSSKSNNINFIQNSEIGNAYKVLGMDVYSDQASQVLEPLTYFYRDVNGDVKGAVTPPTIDPYQPNQAALQMIYVNDFQIFSNTQFQYSINALTSVYLTFTYVNFGVEDFKTFDKVFYQQVQDRFLLHKKLVEQNRLKSFHIE